MSLSVSIPGPVQSEHFEASKHPKCGETPGSPCNEIGPQNGLEIGRPDRRSRNRAEDYSPTEKLPQSISPNGPVGSLLPRPYLLASKAAWMILDFAVAFCCGIFLLLLQDLPGKLSLVPRQPNPKEPSSYLVAVIWIALFAMGVAFLSRLLALHPFRNARPALFEGLLILVSVTLPLIGLAGLLRFWRLPVPTYEILQLLLLTCSILMLCRTLWRRQWDSNFMRDIAAKNVLIVGNGPIGREVRDYLGSLRYIGYRFKGFVTLDEQAGADGEEEEIVGNIEDVISLARSMFADEIIFSSRPATPHLLGNVLNQARSMGIDVRLIPSVCETLNNRKDVQYIGDLPTIVLHQRKKRPLCNLLKRGMDIAIGSIGICAASPVFLVLAILIKWESPGPIFYRSDRVGYKGMTFSCYKFRTMMDKAESMRDQFAHLNERDEILFKIASDPRVTRIGAILRKYSLDELPQLRNVLMGDMSLVGPRPSIRSEVNQYKTAHLRRLDVVPGMTGLWQVEGRHDPSFESYITFDSKYVEQWSLWLDVKILLRTVKVVLKGTGT